MNVKELYKAHYEDYQDYGIKRCSKYTWAIQQVFDIWTYDSELDELFMKSIVEVCKVIRDKTNFDYIKDQQNYIKYIQVCQLLDKFCWIEWGTSIRGAWFDEYCGFALNSKVILKELEWFGPDVDDDGKLIRHTIDSVEFTEDNLYALIEFLEE